MSEANWQRGDSHSQRAQQLALRLRALAAQSPHAWADLDLTMSQMKALFFVRTSGPLTIGQLAETLGTRLASASALVDRLARAGLVVRSVDPTDRRRVRVELSPAGEKLLSGLDERAAARFRRILTRMSPKGLEALERALEELVRLAQEDENEP